MPKTSDINIKSQERRKLVMSLRRSGATYDQICEAVRGKFKEADLPKGYDRRYAWQDIKRELDKLKKDVSEAAEDIRTIEAQRLEAIFLANFPHAIKGDQKMAETCLKIHDRIMKLHGLDVLKVGIDPEQNKMEILVKYDR